MSVSLPLKVMIVGHGMMGENHRKKVEALEKGNKVCLASVVDTDLERLAKLTVPTYQSVDKAYEETLPDIIAVCANTKFHGQLLHKIHELSEKFKRVCHILVEKPLSAHSKEGEMIEKLYASSQGKLSGGYLFRQSSIVTRGIDYLKEKALQLESIETVWQKNRMEKGPPRPSEGVHTDELTHPGDLILNCLLPELGYQIDGVTIIRSAMRRQSEAGQIVDQKKQEELYADDPSKLDPVAEVSYELDAGGITVTGFASFVQGPQKREITLNCHDGTTLCFEFDLLTGDKLTKTSSQGETEILLEEKVDKLLLEWESFLDYCINGHTSYRIQTLTDMLFDLRLTEALGDNVTEPIEIKRLVN